MKKYTLKALIIVLTIAILFNSLPIAYAASSERSEITKKLQETKEDLKEVNNQKEESQNKVNELSSKIDSYETQINSLKTEIATKTKEVEEMQKRLDDLEAEREKNQKLLDERLVTLYESGEVTYMDVLLSSANFTQFISNYYMIETLTAADKELIQKLEDEKNEIAEIQAKLNASLEEIEKKKAELESIQSELNKSKNEEQSKVDELTEQSHDLESDVAAYEKKMKELDAKEQAQEAALQNKIQQAEANYSTSGTSSKGFIRPVNSNNITARMYYSSGAYHGAVDFGVSVGTPVYAAADGVVVTATWGGSDSYGYYVKIKHYNGLYTLYAHASSLAVKVGQVVKQGQVIMYSGNTGKTSGPHLHFEVRTSPGGYKNRVNPLNYLP